MTRRQGGSQPRQANNNLRYRESSVSHVPGIFSYLILTITLGHWYCYYYYPYVMHEESEAH